LIQKDITELNVKYIHSNFNSNSDTSS